MGTGSRARRRRGGRWRRACRTPTPSGRSHIGEATVHAPSSSRRPRRPAQPSAPGRWPGAGWTDYVLFDQALVARDLVETKREALSAALGARRGDARRLRRLPAAGHWLPSSRTASGCPASGWSTCAPCREPGPRLIGNVVIEADLGGGASRSPASRTTAAAPTSGGRAAARRSSRGSANNGHDGVEGVRRGHLVGPTCTAPCCRRTCGSPTG